MGATVRSFALICLALGGLATCAQDPAPPHLRIGYAPHDHHAAVYVMASAPDLVRLGDGTRLEEVEKEVRYRIVRDETTLATLEFMPSVGASQIIQKLEEDHFDLSFGGVPAMVDAIDKGSELRIIAPVMTEGAGFVFRADAGIESWDEFVEYLDQTDEPVRIGYKEEFSVQNLVFETALDAEGIEYVRHDEDGAADVVVVNVHGAANLLPSIADGALDGYVVMQPYAAIGQESGLVTLVETLGNLPPNGMWEDYPCCALAVADIETLERNRETIRIFIDLMHRAHEVIAARPDRSAAIVAEWLGTGVGTEQISLPTVRFKQGFDGKWNRGVTLWIETLVNDGLLTGTVAESISTGTLSNTVYAYP